MTRCHQVDSQLGPPGLLEFAKKKTLSVGSRFTHISGFDTRTTKLHYKNSIAELSTGNYIRPIRCMRVLTFKVAEKMIQCYMTMLASGIRRKLYTSLIGQVENSYNDRPIKH